MKLLDKIANVALILGVTVFLFVVVRGEFAKQEMPDTSPRALVGTSISLPGLQLDQRHDSLLVVISTNCHFCKDGLLFYKELSARAQGKLDVIAVLPQPLAESQAFLLNAGISTTRIISANLNLIGVEALPPCFWSMVREKFRKNGKDSLMRRESSRSLRVCCSDPAHTLNPKPIRKKGSS